jgi:hypothetical protein
MRALPFAVIPAVLLLALLPQDPVEHARMLQRAQQFARVQEPHQALQSLVGSWDLELRTTAAGQKESNDRGTVVGKAILGGRYVVLNFQLTLHGGAIEGVQILGFDNLTQRYTSSWRDDLSTWSVECSGGAEDKDPRHLRLQGQLADASEPTGRAFRLELDLPPKGATGAADKVAMRLYDTVDGRDVLTQEQAWKRR